MSNAFDIAPLPGYPEPYASLLATLQDGTREWREEIWDDVPPEIIVWQPYAGGYSMGGVMLHIAWVESFWIEQFCLGREIDPEEAKLYLNEETDVDAGVWPTPPFEPISYYFEILDKVRTRTLESVKLFGPPETAIPKQDRLLTLRWVLAHVVEHDSYHGGQVVMLKEMASKMSAACIS